MGLLTLVRFPAADPAAARAVRTRLEDAVLRGAAAAAAGGAGS